MALLRSAAPSGHMASVSVSSDWRSCNAASCSTSARWPQRSSSAAPRHQEAHASLATSMRNAPTSLSSSQSRAWQRRNSAVQATRRQRSPVQCVYGGRGSPFEDDYVGGDRSVQQMLVEVLRIQTGKMRISEFADERSQRLRDIADQAHQEYDRIANRTMKGVSDAGAKVLQRLDMDALEIERDLESARQEMEARANQFDAYEERMVTLRNEGLFFKNLYQPSQIRGTLKRYTRAEEIQRRNLAALEKAAQPRDGLEGYRQVLYVGLSTVIVSFIYSAASGFLLDGEVMRWQKLAAYGVVFSLLLLQLVFQKHLVGDGKDVREEKRP